ncbi:hypothetical protein F5876DRAFT_34263 [Lentinula aff. lateritia]|uniref:Uncharacterized protein n=1 Tax=Lentinula aff. lateritia TaxID=2804960 RepID=A0ACC1UB51_9AGAR|nr:hypothetical protein F5876DRAFT_34263 [Lentinula aff. lateritia]
MVNHNGTNGIDNGTKPSDDELKKSLMLYAKKNLSIEMRLVYLKRDHGWTIGKETLRKFNKKFEVPSMRKPPPYAISKTLVCEKIVTDVRQKNGPNAIQWSLKIDGFLIPRDTIRQIIKEEAPESSQFRNPAMQKKKKLHGHLKDVGILEEAHGDGHEKLGHLALCMGGVGINIYGIRDHASGKILFLQVVPNDRDECTIGHVYLDLIEQNGLVIPLQMTVDGGIETGLMYASHYALRYAQYFSQSLHPIFVSLSSTANISIESIWSYWLKAMGYTLHDIIISGKDKGYFIVGNELHVNLFSWLWPRIVQHHLENFKEDFNSNKTRYQPNKVLPSGVSPEIVFDFPDRYGLHYMGCQVEQEAVTALRDGLPRSQKEVYSWVSEDFDHLAQEAYIAIGCPKLECDQGWAIFNKILCFLDL